MIRTLATVGLFVTAISCSSSDGGDDKNEPTGPSTQEIQANLNGVWHLASEVHSEVGEVYSFIAFKEDKYLIFDACFGECMDTSAEGLTEEQIAEKNATELYVPIEYGTYTANGNSINTTLKHTCLPEAGKEFSPTSSYDYSMLDGNLTLSKKTGTIWDALFTETSTWQKMSDEDAEGDDADYIVACMSENGSLIEGKDWFQEAVKIVE